MSPQFFAWLTAFSFACANVTVGYGMRYSTPLTATFVSLIVHTIVLWTALVITSGIPEINVAAVGAFRAVCLCLWPRASDRSRSWLLPSIIGRRQTTINWRGIGAPSHRFY